MNAQRPTGRRIVEDTTCLGCACLCDDIGLVVEGERILEARNACGLGLRWYHRSETELPIFPMVAGVPTAPDAAIDRAAEILLRAKAPAIVGLGTTIEAQRIAVGIADRIGAVITPLYSRTTVCAAFQRLGAVSATLGEVRDRADVLVFDSSAWARRLPRFLERFVEAPGRFIPNGRAGRDVIVFQDPATPAEANEGWTTRPDLLIHVPDRGMAIYPVLRALVNGVLLEPAAVRAATSVPFEQLADLAERLKGAQYGALIHGGESTRAEAEAALALVRDLNRSTRFVAISPTVAPSEPGHSVLAWLTGAAGTVDFALGHPRHLAHEDVITRIYRGEVDALLLIGDVGSRTEFCLEATATAKKAMPKVFVGPVMTDGRRDIEPRQGSPSDALRSLMEADSFLPTAWAGIDEGGSVARFDGLMLPLRPALAERRPTLSDTLRALDDRLAAIQFRQDRAQ